MSRLIDDWHVVARKAWSIRFSLMASGLSSAQAAMEYKANGNTAAFCIVIAVISFASAIARVVAQPKMKDGISGTDE
jgi:hypothetical protein